MQFDVGEDKKLAKENEYSFAQEWQDEMLVV